MIEKTWAFDYKKNEKNVYKRAQQPLDFIRQ